VRGSPLLRSAIVLLALLALAPLVRRLTEPATAGAVTPPPTARVATLASVEARLNFSSPASRVTIEHLGTKIWSKIEPAPEEIFACKIPWPKEGVELRVLIDWPEGAPAAAMRVRIVSPDGTEHDQTVWGSGAVDEVLVFK
jgi:hypothetical protein